MGVSPLDDLLQRLADGRPRTLAGLAADLGVTQDLLEQMLLDLERGGYLRSLNASCGGGCRHCSHQAICRVTHGGRIWALTERGMRRAAQERPSA
jgi:hypothetical protein